jgi:hypothetical protein
MNEFAQSLQEGITKYLGQVIVTAVIALVGYSIDSWFWRGTVDDHLSESAAERVVLEQRIERAVERAEEQNRVLAGDLRDLERVVYQCKSEHTTHLATAAIHIETIKSLVERVGKLEQIPTSRPDPYTGTRGSAHEARTDELTRRVKELEERSRSTRTN